MKTAISVEDALMEQADEAAKDLGLSRSGLVAEALREFLRKRREEKISKDLDRAYGGEPSAAERRLVRKLRGKVPVADRW